MQANEINIDEIYYLLDEEARTAKVIANPYLYEGDIDIPSHINHLGEAYCVTSIGKDAFKGCSCLTSIKLPHGLVCIEDMAFSGCSSLTTIQTPYSIKKIGSGAFCDCCALEIITLPQITNIEPCTFDGCSSLKTLSIPDTVKYISEMAFSHCSSITSLYIPKSVTDIAYDAFDNCSNLSTIIVDNNNPYYNSNNNCNAIIETTSNRLLRGCHNTIVPPSVRTIGRNAFSDCLTLVSIDIPFGVTKIEQGAFGGCNNLTTIILPKSVNVIEDWCFAFCESLKTVELPIAITSIPPYCFYNCSALVSVKTSDCISAIGYCAFMNCKSLTNISLPKNLTSIEHNAFNDCSSLSSIVIPDSVTNIEIGVLSGCSSLVSIEVFNNDTYNSNDGCNAIIESKTKTLVAGCRTTVIPKDVQFIASKAFTGHLMSNIEIPNDVQLIGNYAFSNCIHLSSIVLPCSISHIGNKAFENCASLVEVTLSTNIKSIPNDVFNDCKALKSINIPQGKIEEYCRLGLENYRHLISPIKASLSHGGYPTMSIAAFLTMKGCTPNEIRSGKVELRTTPSGVMRPAFVAKEVLLDSVKEHVLFAHERYSLNTIEEMEKWIEDHKGKDLCVAYTDINNDLAYLCLKANKEQKLPNQKSATKAEYKIENSTENSSNTPSSNDGGSNDIGCIVLSVILTIAILILTIIRTDSDTFATAGAYVMFAVCAIAGYFAYKRISEYSESKGCWPLIIGFVLFVILFNVIGYNYEVNTTIGIIVLVIIFVIGLIDVLSRLNNR